jgi:hypothetical protein
MKYCLGGRVDTANRVRGNRLSTINSSIATQQGHNSCFTPVMGSFLTASQPSTAEGLYTSFGNNISLFTAATKHSSFLD